MHDLSTQHHPITKLFSWPNTPAEFSALSLTVEQVQFYRDNGYVAGIRLLTDEQIDHLRKATDELTNSNHLGRSLFYEYNSNESTNPNTVLFHALGAWRVSP